MKPKWSNSGHQAWRQVPFPSSHLSGPDPESWSSGFCLQTTVFNNLDRLPWNDEKQTNKLGVMARVRNVLRKVHGMKPWSYLEVLLLGGDSVMKVTKWAIRIWSLVVRNGAPGWLWGVSVVPGPFLSPSLCFLTSMKWAASCLAPTPQLPHHWSKAVQYVCWKLKMSPKLGAKINEQYQIPLLSCLVTERESMDLLKILGESEIR